MELLRWMFIMNIWISIILLCTSLTTKEKIEVHKQWLERRANNKKSLFSSPSSPSITKNDKISSFHKLVKFNDNEINLSENDVSKYPKYVQYQSDNIIHRQPQSQPEYFTTTSSTTNTPNIFFTNDSFKSSSDNNKQTYSTISLNPTMSIPLTNSITSITTTASTTTSPNIAVTPSIIHSSNLNLLSSILPSSANMPSTKRRRKLRTFINGTFLNESSSTMRKYRYRRINYNNYFSSWSRWTQCSRSCGGGITTQSRNCLKRINATNHLDTKLSNDCIGIYKRYRICNEQSCPDLEFDFRAAQCIEFNNHTFRGVQYKWEPYIKVDAECELNCRAIGSKYFATLKEKVIDGTQCARPTDRLVHNFDDSHSSAAAICVNGACKAIHSGGVISGEFMNNGAVRCGDTICRSISGVFTDNPIPAGYVPITTIPAGASNISITELKNSRNLIAIKFTNYKFILNGDYSISLSGIYEAARAMFDYRRIDGLSSENSYDGDDGGGGGSDENSNKNAVTEWLTCTGPIAEPIDLLLFHVLSEETNTGIKYEYLLPINTTSTTTNDSNESNNNNNDEYSAGISSENELDSNLVSGANHHALKSGSAVTLPTSPTTISTIPSNSIAAIPSVSSLSSPLSTSISQSHIPQKPLKKKRRLQWKILPYSACSKSCGGGIQSVIIRCVRENPLRQFSAKHCSHVQKPSINNNMIRCNTQPCPAYWKLDEWSKCNCGNFHEDGFQIRDVKCVQELKASMVVQVRDTACPVEDKPIDRHACGCSSLIKHDRTYRKNHHHLHHNNNNRLNYGIKSNQTSMVPNAIRLKHGIWLSSNWNEQCSVECGEGVQYRSIFCDRSPPNLERCEFNKTPQLTKQCMNTDEDIMAKCNSGEWATGQWHQCMGDCFNSTQSRSIWCIKNELIVSIDHCDGIKKPDESRRCDMSEMPDCKARWHYSEWTECNRKCGGGTQRRIVKCFEPQHGEIKESDNCLYSKRMPAIQNCNTHICETSTTSTTTTTTEKSVADPRVDLIQNDTVPDCVDEGPNCKLALLEYLCNYAYFKKRCCITCNIQHTSRLIK